MTRSESCAERPAPGFWFGCVWCGLERHLDLRGTCQMCGGTLEVRGGTTREPRLSHSLWAYADALPVPQHVSLGEGATPLVRLKEVAARDDLYAKCEWTNPTGSFKDRGSTVAISAALEFGAAGVVCASTGNNAASVSAYAARAGLSCLVVLPRSTASEKIFQTRLHGATIMDIDGNFSDAYRVAAAIAEANPGWPNLTSTFVNPFMTAAHATIAYELVAELGEEPGTVIIPIGAGPMLVGIHDGFARLIDAGIIERLPMLVGVQAAGCAPIARAFEAGRQSVEAWPEHVASCAGSINDPLVGYPEDGTRTLKAIRDSRGLAVAVKDEEMLTATHALAAREGMGCEPAAAATLAAFRRLENRGLPGPVILTCSGHALKDPTVRLDVEVPGTDARTNAAASLARTVQEVGLPKCAIGE